MRNLWYPNKNAQYMTQAEVKEAKQLDVIRDRDPFFASEVKTKGIKKRMSDAPQVDISIAMLSVGYTKGSTR